MRINQNSTILLFFITMLILHNNKHERKIHKMKSITRKICTALMALTFVSAPLYSLPITSAAPAANEVVAYAANDYFYYPASSSTTENRFKCKLVSYTENGQTKQGIRIESVEIKKASVTVPPTISYSGHSYAVVEIGDYFASGNTTMTTLSLPSSLLKIGFCFCYNASKLNTVNFSGNKLTALGAYPLCGTIYRNAQEIKGYSILGNALYYLNPNMMIVNQTLDLSSSSFNSVTLIVTGLGNSLSNAKTIKLPKNLQNLNNASALLNGFNVPNLTGLYYYSSNRNAFVDLKTVIKNHAENNASLYNSDKAFIEKCNGFFNAHNLNTPSEQPYKHAIIQSLAKKFLAQAGVTYYGTVQNNNSSTFTAWKQYNAVRKIVCHCRNTINYGTGTNNFVVALLLNKTIVCQQYAQLNQAMLMCAGIDAKYLYSVAEGAHAWNLVRIRDKDKGDFWFNVDATATWNPNRRYFMFKDIPSNATFPYAACHIRHSECNVAPWATTQIGDVDRDGFVSAADASRILQAATRIVSGQSSGLLSIQEVLCDVNSDGQIGVDDAQIVLSYYTDCSTGNWNDTLEEYIVQKFPGVYPQN